MTKNKKKIIGFIVAIAIVCISGIVNATYVDTFTTDDGIVATKTAVGNTGNIEIKFSNISLNSQNGYTWAISRTSKVEEAVYSANLGDFSEKNLTAIVSLTTSEEELWQLLRETNIAYIFIYDETNEVYVVDGLQLDLTLPVLQAFNVTKYDGEYDYYEMSYILSKNGEAVDYDFSKMNNDAKATYDIENMYFQFVKITDNSIISSYNSSSSLYNVDGLASIDEAPESEWILASDEGVGYNTKILEGSIPEEEGLYYLWLKGKDSDTKTVWGYTLIEIGEIELKSNVERIVTYPSSGTYTTGQTVKITVHFDQEIVGSEVPTLKFKFGDSTEREVSVGVIDGDEIEYSYNIQPDDVGQLLFLGYEGGNLVTADGTLVILSCPTLTSEIRVNLEGIDTNYTENQDDTTVTSPDDTTTQNTTTTTTTTQDTTTSTTKLPSTGIKTGIVCVILSLFVIKISYSKYNKMKDIK